MSALLQMLGTMAMRAFRKPGTITTAGMAKEKRAMPVRPSAGKAPRDAFAGHLRGALFVALLAGGWALLAAPLVTAQVTPAAGYTPPDDTPSIKVGATIFPNFTYQEHPEVTDSDGNVVRKSSFDVTRTYINITGNISHIVAFRITPDISRETDPASANNGSLVFRLKYGFLQLNLDDWMTKGSWVRFGIQQTPYIDYAETIYRYRFQGTTFTDRVGAFPASDAGVSLHYNFPSNYGDAQIGFYNGEGYNKPEVNEAKATFVRASFRPFAAGTPLARGLRATIVYDYDNYLQDAPRTRLVANATFESKYVNAGFDYLDRHDQTSALLGTPNVHATGYSFWVNPKTPMGWEALVRFDEYKPNTSSALASNGVSFDSQSQDRLIAGIAYWFHHMGSVTSALMLDWDGQIFRNQTTQPVRLLGVHGLINF